MRCCFVYYLSDMEIQKKERLKVRTLRISDSDWRKLEIIASQEEVFVSDLIRQVLIDFASKRT